MRREKDRGRGKPDYLSLVRIGKSQNAPGDAKLVLQGAKFGISSQDCGVFTNRVANNFKIYEEDERDKVQLFWCFGVVGGVGE